MYLFICAPHFNLLYTKYVRKGGRPTLPKKPLMMQKLAIKLIEKYWTNNPKRRGTFAEVLNDLKQLEKEISD